MAGGTPGGGSMKRRVSTCWSAVPGSVPTSVPTSVSWPLLPQRHKPTVLQGSMAVALAGWSVMVLADAPAAGMDARLESVSLTPSVVVSPPLAHARLQALEVSLNGTAVGTWEVMEHEGGYWVEASTLKAWRLLLPAQARALMHRQRLWWPLHAVPGYRSALNPAHQTLSLEVWAGAFEPSAPAMGVAVAANRGPTLTEAMPAVFVNYDATWTESRGLTIGQSDRGLMTEVGLTGPAGVLLWTQVARWAQLSNAATVEEHRRLETHYTREWPDRDLMLRLGDGWTRMSTWGRQAAFGGVQIGTQRSLWRPGLGLATPLLAGSALTASTVELYVNDALRQTVQVPAGPFTLENLAPLTGSGQARLVVRDLLGRETVIERPFFTDPQLLAPGRMDWSLEAGRARRGIGLGALDDSYGAAFAQVWARRGLSPGLTVESRLQTGSGLTNLGAAAVMSVADLVLLQTAVSGSSRDGRRGSSVMLNLQTPGLRDGLALRVVGSSRDHTEVGRPASEPVARLEASLSARLSLGPVDGLGGTAGTVRRHDGRTFSTASVSWNRRLEGFGQMVWGATRVVSGGGTVGGLGSSIPGATDRLTTLQAMLMVPLGARSSGARPMGTVQAQQQRGAEGRGHLDFLASVNAPVVSGSEWEWRALAAHRRGQSTFEAGLQRPAPSVVWALDLSANEGSGHAVRGMAQGAWVWAGGGLHAARRIQDAFALVEVPGQADVGVGLDGPPLARTNAQGTALLPRLSAYRPNRVRLDANDLSPDAELDTIEQSPTPPWRSAVRVRFDVREGRAAILAFRIADGQPAPRGATLRLDGETREFIVGSRGEVYVTGLPPGTPRRVALTWQGSRCEVDVRWVAADGLPRLGPWDCPEIAP